MSPSNGPTDGTPPESPAPYAPPAAPTDYAPPGYPPPGYGHPPQGYAPPPPVNPRARSLVNWSHALGWGGLGTLLLIGPIIGFGSGSPTLAFVLMGAGLVSTIVGAILGQIGRSMQGRVI